MVQNVYYMNVDNNSLHYVFLYDGLSQINIVYLR